MTTPQAATQHEIMLEAMVDSTDLRAVVLALSVICYGKAEHVETNWQDKHLARRWRHNAQTLEKASAKLHP